VSPTCTATASVHLANATRALSKHPFEDADAGACGDTTLATQCGPELELPSAHQPLTSPLTSPLTTDPQPRTRNARVLTSPRAVDGKLLVRLICDGVFALRASAAPKTRPLETRLVDAAVAGTPPRTAIPGGVLGRLTTSAQPHAGVRLSAPPKNHHDTRTGPTLPDPTH
jgi:hypothetical protein